MSALDVSVQAAIVNLLIRLRAEADGQLCEVGPTASVFAPPHHPYTAALLAAVPVPDPSARRARRPLEGSVPTARTPPSGCRFHPQCPRKLGPICETTAPPVQPAGPSHWIACHIPVAHLHAPSSRPASAAE